MFHYIIRWLKGYLYICISGNSGNRFINICSRNNLRIWKVCAEDNDISFYIARKDYKKMLEFGKKVNVDIQVLNKIGLPFFFYRYKKRKCFAIGLLLCVVIVYGFTLFIWDINIQGTEVYTAEQITGDIVKNYVHVGTLRKSVDCAELEKELREKYDNVAWISCYIEGTRLNIVLTETIEPDMINRYDTPCNIVAAKDGVITDILATSGSKIASVGDEVKKGDILITGVVNIYNEYDELLETEYLPAAGTVYAVSQYDYYDAFPLEYYDKEYTGEKKKYFSLCWFGNVYTPYQASFKDNAYDSVTYDHMLMIGNTYYMPVGFRKTVIREYNPVLLKYSKEGAEEKARKRLENYLDNLRKKGVEILENNVTIKVGEEACEVKGSIVVKELIGVPSDITVFEEGE